MTTESVLETIVVDDKQERDFMLRGMPNAFARTEVPQSYERNTMNIHGALADRLLEMDLENHQVFVIGEGRTKVLCTHVAGTLYSRSGSVLVSDWFRPI